VLTYDNLEYFGRNDENRERPVIVHQSTFSFFENGDNGSLLPEGKENRCYKVRLSINLRTILKYSNNLGLISFTNFNAQFLYSLTICLLYYNPRHVSSINMPIFRRTNCIITASGIVTVCIVQPFTESEDTRCCDNIICPPEDGHVDARNMSRIVI
jgi:hypothetical protein